MERNARYQILSPGGARAVLLATVLLSSFGAAWAADGAVDLTVLEGTTRVVVGPLDVQDLVVLGTLVVDAPDGAVLGAERVHVGPRGVVQGVAGAAGADATGDDATGARGEDGGSVVVVAEVLVVDEGGRIDGGPGGRGGRAQGLGVVTGGDGGDGGSVVLQAVSSDVRGHVLPGAGGAGGNALQVVEPGVVVGDDARAVGGAGGDTGRALLDGKEVRVDRDAARPAPSAFAEPFPQESLVSVLGVFPAYVAPCAGIIGQVNPVGTPGNPSSPLISAGAGGQACMIAVGQPGAPGGACQPGGAAALSAKAVAIGGRGGDGFVIAANGGTGGMAWAGAQGGDGGAGGDCSGGPGGAGTGGGGASATATGGEGGLGGDSPFAVLGGIGGVGGVGGDAFAEAQAGRGGDGGDGTSAGGGGGGGGVAASTAEAGNGGKAGATNAPGGAGGDAEAYGASGKGGKGGTGAVKGGDGGDAGKLTKLTAKGGQPGAGMGPGAGGDATTSVDPEGGDGGYPDGVGGAGGDWIVISLAGFGGAATNIVPEGTGAGGVGGDGDPDNNRGHGNELLNLAIPGSVAATLYGPSCESTCDVVSASSELSNGYIGDEGSQGAGSLPYCYDRDGAWFLGDTSDNQFPPEWGWGGTNDTDPSCSWLAEDNGFPAPTTLPRATVLNGEWRSGNSVAAELGASKLVHRLGLPQQVQGVDVRTANMLVPGTGQFWAWYGTFADLQNDGWIEDHPASERVHVATRPLTSAAPADCTNTLSTADPNGLGAPEGANTGVSFRCTPIVADEWDGDNSATIVFYVTPGDFNDAGDVVNRRFENDTSEPDCRARPRSTGQYACPSTNFDHVVVDNGILETTVVEVISNPDPGTTRSEERGAGSLADVDLYVSVNPTLENLYEENVVQTTNAIGCDVDWTTLANACPVLQQRLLQVAHDVGDMQFLPAGCLNHAPPCSVTDILSPLGIGAENGMSHPAPVAGRLDGILASMGSIFENR